MSRHPTDRLRGRLVRVEELVDVLAVMGAPMSRSTLHRAAARGEVPGRLILGRRVLFAGDAVADWLQGMSDPSPSRVDETTSAAAPLSIVGRNGAA